jgi:hypothetical protein
MNNSLPARVEAVNLANSYANSLYPKLIEVFTPFVGQKIITQSGSLFNKIQNLVDKLELPNTSRISVYKNICRYSLSYVVKVCIVYNEIAHYHESYFYVGEIRENFLTKICDGPEYKENYTEEGIRQARLDYENAKKIADEAESKLYPFGQYDR